MFEGCLSDLGTVGTTEVAGGELGVGVAGALLAGAGGELGGGGADGGHGGEGAGGGAEEGESRAEGSGADDEVREEHCVGWVGLGGLEGV